MMFEHGVARAGYIEAPRDPDLAYEFLKTEWRTIQHYGVEIGGRRYDGAILDRHRNTSSAYGGKGKGRWPFQVDPDDVARHLGRRSVRVPDCDDCVGVVSVRHLEYPVRPDAALDRAEALHAGRAELPGIGLLDDEVAVAERVPFRELHRATVTRRPFSDIP